ncbi:MAG: pirin family protein [Woeseiaceae bacterium]|nr:pirin family protein [Woeseiaceae bacterium]
MTNPQSVDLVLRPRERDLGEFTVRRVLPAARRRAIGPFVFFDHMGPAVFPPGKGIAVRPHPHIGIATITYLFEGQIMHRDSLGVTQAIEAGAVNLMTAGRGIVHSERAGDDLDATSSLHGIQSWIALPNDKEEIEPAFEHIPASELPEFEQGGCTIRVIMGECLGRKSPVPTYSETLYLDVVMQVEGTLALPDEWAEFAVYVVEGSVMIDGEHYESGAMAIAGGNSALAITANADSRVMVIGGDSVGERHIYWNFVHSSEARIEQAKDDWREGRFEMVPGDGEFIPLPD